MRYRRPKMRTDLERATIRGIAISSLIVKGMRAVGVPARRTSDERHDARESLKLRQFFVGFGYAGTGGGCIRFRLGVETLDFGIKGSAQFRREVVR